MCTEKDVGDQLKYAIFGRIVARFYEVNFLGD